MLFSAAVISGGDDSCLRKLSFFFFDFTFEGCEEEPFRKFVFFGFVEDISAKSEDESKRE